MQTEIRKATYYDIEQLIRLYDNSRAIMKATDNQNQWIDGYPSEEIIRNDIANGNSYVVLSDDEIVGVFVFIIGDDPTYAKIYEGNWLNDKPYGVIHRIATSGKLKGVTSLCIDWCFTQIDNIRIDTHRDNIIMHKILKNHGFIECGIIYVANGTERIAYQKGQSPNER